jgi:hypothetical protein
VTTIDLVHPQLRDLLVQEIFTATQRVTLEAQKRGHLTGDPLFLGWDFMKALDRRAAYAKVKREKPYFLVLAYPCGPWSPLQRLNPAADLPEKREAHRELIRFALSLARLQLRNGRHFILENPVGSESWSLPEIIKFLEEEEAKLARFDQCRFNLRSADGWLHKWQPAVRQFVLTLIKFDAQAITFISLSLVVPRSLQELGITLVNLPRPWCWLWRRNLSGSLAPSPRKLWLRKMEVVMKFQVMKKNKWPAGVDAPSSWS